MKYIIIGILIILMFLNNLILIPILTSIALVISYLFDQTLDKNKEPTIKYLGIFIMLMILFSPFSFAYGAITQDYLSADNQLKYMGPGYNQQWQLAGKWARENTAKESVFAHWWDYGYWVQSGFQRATVGDGGNFIGWWNYLMGRKVLTGQTQEEALPFLFSHNVTNLLIVQDEIGKYTAYSSIGSDENYDRFSYITTFNLNSQLTKETRNGTVIFYQGGFALDENFIYKNDIYPAGQAGIIGIKVPFESKVVANSTIQELKQPSVVLGNQNKLVELSLKCIYFNSQLYEFENAEYDGCFRIVPVFSNQNQANMIGAGYFLSRRTYHSNFGQLYMLNKESKYFKLVYDDSNNFPLGFYQGRQIGPMKIWNINYPNNFTINQEEFKYNTRTDYPDQELLKPK